MPGKIAAGLAVVQAAAALDFTPCIGFNREIESLLAPLGTPFTPFDCANVPVPLDYTSNESDSLDLRVFRVNATQQPVLGNLLVNFGGPGGAGADNLPAWAGQLAYIVGPRWNIISWDPRGTGTTIPFNCTVTGDVVASSNTNKRQLSHLLSTNVTQGFTDYGWKLAGKTAETCANQAEETATLIGTAFVARDVIKIVDALNDGDLLNYYGWSYGTALGSYIAAMFPDRIGHMVLDGNVNPHQYQSGTYADLADDVDTAFDGFLQTCFEARQDCSLYVYAQPKRKADLLAAVNVALATYEKAALGSAEAYLAWIGVKSQLYQPLYFPNQWPQLADLIVLTLNGTARSEPSVGSDAYGKAVNAVYGIRASDATFHANTSDEYLPTVAEEAIISKSFSDSAYVPLWVSARWLMPAKERYWGTFQAETKHPILYVNGEHDPITPIVGAYNGSSGFRGSVVLAHSGYGHGLLADPSLCASQYVQAYLENNTLPAEGELCAPDRSTLQIWRANMQTSKTAGNHTTGRTNGTTSASPPTGSSDRPSSRGIQAQRMNECNSIVSGARSSAVVSGTALLAYLMLHL